ncbi:MAG TPA: flagellar hook-basal body complex protein FliE [Candidatus Latescibacteria bacterium]|nr:flagellar hook-basal body complex protein FliE [Candidatus Latescibacterota bacterium]
MVDLSATGGITSGPESIPSVSSQARKGRTNFADLFKGFIKDVNRLQLEADNAIELLATGGITEIHQVMVAVEEANIALQLMLEVRNRLLEGYQELMRMPI